LAIEVFYPEGLRGKGRATLQTIEMNAAGLDDGLGITPVAHAVLHIIAENGFYTLDPAVFCCGRKLDHQDARCGCAQKSHRETGASKPA
jgi:hypothetical protein